MAKIAICTLSLALATHVSWTRADSLELCIPIGNDKERLACFDRYAEAHYQKQENKFGAVKTEEIPSEKSFNIVHVRLLNKKHIITLDNGQRWMQAESARTLNLNENDTVVITSGALSSYFLQKKGTSVKTKFKRLK